MARAVQVNILDGNLGLQPGSNSQIMLLMGPCLGNNAGGGAPNTLYTFGDPVTAQNSLRGGELLELVGYILNASPGAIVQAMPLNASTRGGVGTVTHTGPGAAVVTATLAPAGAITITCTGAGALGTAIFTASVTDPVTGITITSSPIQSAASWSTTGVAIPGTYTTVVFTAGTYVAGATPDIYTISTAGVVAHPQGTGPVVPTFTASPVDAYRVIVTFVTGGPVGTSQFTYSLDNGTNISPTVTSAATYAIPGSGLVLGITGIATVGDTYAFSTAPPTFALTDLNAAHAALQTTYLNSFIASQVGIAGSVASAAAWASLVSACETAALAFQAQNMFIRYHVGGPTVGTVLPAAGSITVDSADTDTVVIAARAGMSAPHVDPAAGDGLMISPVTGLQFRRNAIWGAMGRAAAVSPSEDIGAVADGGIASFTSCVRDDFTVGLTFFNAGITSFQTYGAGTPVMINRGFTGTVATSDYYPLTNARVIDKACTIAVANARQYVLAKIPTQTRANVPGCIREDAAKDIEGRISSALSGGLVDSSPQDAVAVSCVVTRTNQIAITGNLIITVAVQGYGYAITVTLNVGLALQA